MVKESKKAEKTPDVKFVSNGSLEKSEKERDSASDEEQHEEVKTSKKKSKHGRRQRKVSESGSDDHHQQEEEKDDEDGKAGSEAGESVAIPIEDDAADAPDGKVNPKQANSYAAKKTVAQGMMDIALITANANQLRYLVEFNSHSSTFYINVTLIIISLLLQVGVGVSLIFKGGLDLKGQSKHRYAKRINNYVVVGVFLVTIINVFVASFTVTGMGAGAGAGGGSGTSSSDNSNGVKVVPVNQG